METLRDLHVLEIIQKEHLEEARREAELAARLRELNLGRPSRLAVLLSICLVLVPIAIWFTVAVAG